MSINYNNLHIGIVAGSASSEHDVSLNSANTVYQALQTLGATLYPLYLDKHNHWFLLENSEATPFLNTASGKAIHWRQEDDQILMFHQDNTKLGCINLFFPVLHGRYGEDGAIQGLFELWGVPYVGSNVAASATAMDKEFTKIILATEEIPSIPHILLANDEFELAPSFADVCDLLKISAVFVKPARAGSSIGVSKVENSAQWLDALKLAFEQDSKLLIEPAYKVREIEIAILDNGKEQKASLAGEIIYHSGFYDYEQKYADESQVELKIPAPLESDLLSNLQQLALRAHRRIGCKGLSRVDFFVLDDNSIYLNEINTLPGFTSVSMYPLLWEVSDIPIDVLMKELIQSALIHHHNDH